MKRWIILGTAMLAMAVSAQQTNVLLIIADDLGIDSLAAFNDDPSASLPPTPTIDNIQSNGITFTRFYTYSTCSPTRSAILTGRYAYRTGVYSPEDNDLAENEFTLPDALIESGVVSNRLAHIGKWHLGSAATSPSTLGGWPHFSGALGGGVNNYTNWAKTVNGVTATTTNYATSDNVDDAADWIDAQGTNSWFLWLAFNAPHTPLHRPPNNLHTYTGMLSQRQRYEAMVEAMDTEMARLLTHIDLAETTVIFMGDNGTPGNYIQLPFSNSHAKGSAYEGGIRVPLLIYGAAVSNGLENTVYDGHLHSVDLYATILDLFGVDFEDVVPEELVYDSRSFAAVLRGEAYSREPVVVVDNNFGSSPARSIMEGDYKYIAFTNGTEELYNVTLDLPEATNLFEGALSPTEQSAYESLTNQLATFINVPEIFSTYMDTNGHFNVEIGWFDNEGFTLYRTDNLVSNIWSTVAGQEFENNGDAALMLRDPSPPSSNAFYYVTTP